MRLKITMKSGRAYKTKRLKDYTIKHTGIGITSISVTPESSNRGYGVFIGTIRLSDIEAVEEVR